MLGASNSRRGAVAGLQRRLRTRDEVPHSITVDVEEAEDDGRNHPEDVLRLHAVVRVERESQKGIVIGRGGSVLKEAATEARRELEALLGTRIFLETTVRVERDWQRRPQALDRLGPAADKVQPIFITIDPARDTPEQLKGYAANFHPRLVALTGSNEAVAAAAKAYRVYYGKSKETAGQADYLMDHSSIVFLMDKDGRYLTHFTHATSVEAMVAGIRKQLS